MKGVHCGIALIYSSLTTGSATTSAKPAFTAKAFRSLALKSTFAQITQQFGAPLNKRDLKNFLGVASLTPLIQSQRPTDRCAYYLNTADPTARAFQLCFNSSYALVEKAILTTSGS